MNFSQVILKGIRVDLLKSKIVINLELDHTPENIELSDRLSQYKPTPNSSGYMTVSFEPKQLPLFDKE